MRPRALCLLVVAAFAIAPAARAQEMAELRIRAPDGSGFVARVPSGGTFVAACTDRPPTGTPADDRATTARLIVDGRESASFRMYVVGGRIYLRGAPGGAGRWCTPNEPTLRAIAAARAMPSARPAWLAFAVAFVGLGVVIALVAIAGAGTGPRPTLTREGQPPDTDEHEAVGADGH